MKLNRNLCIFTGFVAFAEYLIIAYIILHNTKLHMDFSLETPFFHNVKASLYLLSGISMGWVTERIKNKFLEGYESIEERNRIRSLFGQHLSPTVVDQLISQGTSF